MDKLSILDGWRDPPHRARTRTEWADAETRGFLARPNDAPPFGKILRVISLAAMFFAGAKLAWLLVFRG